MRFLMLVCRDESIPFTPEQRAKIGPEVGAWVQEMKQRGVRLLGDVLAPALEATIVRSREGGVEIQSGPRVPGAEQISGFNLIECRDLDEALEVSAKHPIARFGAIELRAIVEM